MTLAITMIRKKSICLTSLAVVMALPLGSFDVKAEISEMVVSVRKRDEFIQTIPISIEAFSATEISRLGFHNISDVAELTPSIVYDQGADPTTIRISIRGLHPSRGRQNVAVLVDGIDVGTEAIGAAGGGLIMNSRITDIERVEIVKGPQSTLYGRSAFGGAIQYITKDPSDEFSGDVSFDIGNYGRYDVGASLSGPVIDDVLGLRLNTNYWSDNGFYNDEATRSSLGGGDGFGVALTANLNASDALSFKARVEYSEADFDPQADFLVHGNTGKRNIVNDPLLAAVEAEDPTILGSDSVVLFEGLVPDGDGLGRPLHSPDPLTGDRFAGSERDVFRASLVATWGVGIGTITSYTGYTNADGNTRQDSDGDADLENVMGALVDISRRGSILDYDSDIEQFSQELRFASDWDFPVQFTFGGLYWMEDSKRLARTIGANCGSPTSGTDVCNDLLGGVTESSAELVRQVTITPSTSSREVDHWSLYAMLEWDITDQFKLTGEARYNNEDETVVAPSCDLARVADLVIAGAKGAVTNPCEDPLSTSTRSMYGPSTIVKGLQNGAVYGVAETAKTDSDWWTPGFSIEWTPTDEMLLYASASRGVKPAGTTTLVAGAWFDVDHDGSLDERTFSAEKLWSYEVGGKISWLDTLQTNVAVFLQDYKDKQVLTSIVAPSGNAVPVIENAGAAEVFGVEFSGVWQPFESLTLGLGYTYLDTEYKEFLAFTDSKSRIIRAGNCTVTTLDNGDGICETDLSGNELEKAPKHSVVGQASFWWPANGLANLGTNTDWFLEGDVVYQSRRFGAQENYRILDEYTVANVRIGLSSDEWEVLLYVDNVFADDTVKAGTTKTGSVDRLNPLYTAAPNTIRSSTNAFSADLPDPRTFGGRVSFKF